MFHLDALFSTIPISKSYTLQDDGKYDSTAYPMLKNFTSLRFEINNIQEFYLALLDTAQSNGCLIKGELARQIEKESRAGLTSPDNATHWLVFDVDGLPGAETVTDFLGMLPQAFQDTSYIVQYSASSGIKPGLRAHVFFLMEEPQLPATLRNFVTDLNVSVPQLLEATKLSASKMTLRFPLDRTVNQSDKMIYVAPPQCTNFEDPFGVERWQLFERKHPVVKYDFAPFADEKCEARLELILSDRIVDLRKAEGLRKRAPRFKMDGDHHVLVNPDEAQVTSWKEERGFTYLNLNGGDSWGYYYLTDKPRLLRNFKDEPIMRLKDVVPLHWKDVVQPKLTSNLRTGAHVFRCRQEDAYYTFIYDPVNDEVTQLFKISKANIANFMANHDMPVPDPIPEYTLMFRPDLKVVFDPDLGIINRWKNSEYLKLKPKEGLEIPPIISKVLNSVLGGDPECVDRFVNWLAVIFQKRKKTGQAWVMHGVPGTGKGVLFHQILKPIFGQEYCIQTQFQQFEDRYNGFLDEAVLINVDEAVMEGQKPSIISEMKNWITEPHLRIRRMYVNSYIAQSFVNFIFTSNDYDAVRIGAGDRRFSVAPRQETSINLTNDEIEEIQSELFDFAQYLGAYKINERLASSSFENKAKTIMVKATRNSVEEFAEALRGGDLEYMVSPLVDKPMGGDLLAYEEYAQVVAGWYRDMNAGRPTVVTPQDAKKVYTYTHKGAQGGQRIRVFLKMMSHKGLSFEEIHKVGEHIEQGVLVVWEQLRPETAELYKHNGILATLDSKKDKPSMHVVK